MADHLIDALRYAIMQVQGCTRIGALPVSNRGIDEKTGTVNVYELLPEPGDSIMVVNCGTHFEIRHHHWETPPLGLTEEDIDKLKQGLIKWN